MFTNIESKSISQKIIEQIQDNIMSGQLNAGDPLPPERDLAEAMAVSRSALREAIKALEVMGILECHQGRGNFIVNRVNENFYKPMSLAFKLSKGRNADLLEFRKMIEYYAVPAAALKASPLDIAQLYEIDDMMKKESDIEKKIEIDWQFHAAIARISNNPLVLSTLNDASYLFDTFVNNALTANLSKGDSWDSVYREHDMILKALEQHDENAALEAIKTHLSSIMIDCME